MVRIYAESLTMKTNHFFAISLLLILGLTLCTSTGCKKKDATGNAPPVAANEAGTIIQTRA